MPSTYSDLKIQLMATGENNTTWGDITNLNLEALEDAIVGSADVTFASANVTLTLTDANTPQTARNVRLRCTGTTGGASRNLVVPSIEKPYIVQNDCADNIVVKTAAGTGVTVPPGRTMWVMSDGVNVVDVVTHLSGLTLNAPLPLAQGGTGATAAPAARTALGATTLGSNLFTITNPSAITFPRFNADNTVSALSAADFRTAIGVGTGTGTVTSVQVSGGTTGLTATGGPITSSGTITLGGTLAVANGGTGTTSSTGTGAVVLQSNATLGGVTLSSNTLGGVAGNNSIPLATSVPNTLNVQQVRLVEERVSAGTDWTTTRSRLYTRIDVTDQTYIDLRTDTATPAIAFGTGGPGALFERMRITQGGDVGIGTDAPGVRLDVIGNAIFGRGGGTFQGISLANGDNSALAETVSFVDARNNLGTADGHMFFGHQTDGGSYVTWATTAPGARNTDRRAERVRITASGDVGIGTQAPSTALHVNRAGATDTRVTVSNGNAAIQTGVEPGGVGFLFNNQNFALAFGTNGVERARISAAGDVGIGTTSPQGRFHVVTGTNNSVLVRGPVNFGSGGSVYGVNSANSVLQPLELTGSLVGIFGDVGLGTTNPQARLHVAGGNIRLDNTFSLTFRNPANTGNATFTYQGDDNFVAYNAANVPIWNFTGGASPITVFGCSANTRVTFSGNNVVFRTDGVDRFTLDGNGDVTSANRAAAVGFKGVPPSGITSGTITTADIGRCVPATAGVTAPSGTFARGDTITIYHDSASAITITQGAGLTLRLAGTTTTGNRTLAARGMATLWYNSASEAIASGPGLT